MKRNQTSSIILQLKKIKGSVFKGVKRNEIYSESLFLNSSDLRKTGFFINPVYFNCPIEYFETENNGKAFEQKNSLKISKIFLQINDSIETEAESVINKGITQNKISFLQNLRFNFFNYVDIEEFLTETTKFIEPNFLVLSEIKRKKTSYLNYLVKLKNTCQSMTKSVLIEIDSLIKNMNDYYEVYLYLIESKGKIQLEY